MSMHGKDLARATLEAAETDRLSFPQGVQRLLPRHATHGALPAEGAE